MNSFKERDVRRQYGVLQHKLEQGLTQLKATVGEDVIGIGLFDNEEEFVSECRRYNELGTLYVGVNPRSVRLLEDYAGLKNRMRSLFTDVVTEADIDYVTGVAVRDVRRLTVEARSYVQDCSVLADREILFALDEPIAVSQDDRSSTQVQVAKWMYGQEDPSLISLVDFIRVIGTALPQPGWFRRRTQFRKYRPYILENIASKITGEDGKKKGRS
ncbi:MAG: hypothetical protein O2954_20040 [bacterium]|nr:hypothetical protein [bacterium]